MFPRPGRDIGFPVAGCALLFAVFLAYTSAFGPDQPALPVGPGAVGDVGGGGHGQAAALKPRALRR